MRFESSTTEIRDRRRDWLKTQWANNHVNFLLAFVGVVLLVNLLAVAYLQSKFVPLKFPDARAFAEGEADDETSQLLNDQQIRIRITGAPSQDGLVVVRVSDSSENFSKTSSALMTEKLALVSGEANWRIDLNKLPEAFALTAFHDADRNGEITLNAMGVPTERYGYSGNYRFIEPDRSPDFEQVKIPRPAAGATIDLFLR